jgi:hypothetical protein
MVLLVKAGRRQFSEFQVRHLFRTEVVCFNEDDVGEGCWYMTEKVDLQEETSRKGGKTARRSKSGGFLLGTLIAIVVAALIGGGGYAIYSIVDGSDETTSGIDEVSIAYAERNLANLFKSAQQTFIHRNGKRMAESIEELGENFSVGSGGTIIYREIWYARYGRPETDIPEVSKQEDWEKKALADPYRYAVLPVRNLETPQLDARTSVLVALPVAETDLPALLVVAGPVRSDPADFLREWPVRRIITKEGSKMLRDRVKAGSAYDKVFADKLAPHIESL